MTDEEEDDLPVCEFCGTPPHDLNRLIGSSITGNYICNHCVRDLYLRDAEIERMLYGVSPSTYVH